MIELPPFPEAVPGTQINAYLSAIRHWAPDFNAALVRANATLNNAYLSVLQPVRMPLSTHPDAPAYVKAVALALQDHRTTHPNEASVIRISTRTANVLASTIPGPVDVRAGGQIMGVPYELDDDLNDGEIMAE